MRGWNRSERLPWWYGLVSDSVTTAFVRGAQIFQREQLVKEKGPRDAALSKRQHLTGVRGREVCRGNQ